MPRTLNTHQRTALAHILYTDSAIGINRNTLKALQRRGFINSVYQVTCAGIAAINPDAPQPVITAEMEETRRAQDQLIAIIEKRGWDLAMRLSRDLPKDITGLSLCRMIYPEYLSDIKRMIIQFSR